MPDGKPRCSRGCAQCILSGMWDDKAVAILLAKTNTKFKKFPPAPWTDGHSQWPTCCAGTMGECIDQTLGETKEVIAARKDRFKHAEEKWRRDQAAAADAAAAEKSRREAEAAPEANVKTGSPTPIIVPDPIPQGKNKVPAGPGVPVFNAEEKEKVGKEKVKSENKGPSINNILKGLNTAASVAQSLQKLSESFAKGYGVFAAHVEREGDEEEAEISGEISAATAKVEKQVKERQVKALTERLKKMYGIAAKNNHVLSSDRNANEMFSTMASNLLADNEWDEEDAFREAHRAFTLSLIPEEPAPSPMKAEEAAALSREEQEASLEVLQAEYLLSRTDMSTPRRKVDELREKINKIQTALGKLPPVSNPPKLTDQQWAERTRIHTIREALIEEKRSLDAQIVELRNKQGAEEQEQNVGKYSRLIKEQAKLYRRLQGLGAYGVELGEAPKVESQQEQESQQGRQKEQARGGTRRIRKKVRAKTMRKNVKRNRKSHTFRK